MSLHISKHHLPLSLIVALIFFVISIILLILYKQSFEIRYCDHSWGLRYDRERYQETCQCTHAGETFLDDGSRLGDPVNFYCVRNDILMSNRDQMRRCASTIMPHLPEYKQMIQDCNCSGSDEIILFDSSYVGKPVNLYCAKKHILPHIEPPFQR